MASYKVPNKFGGGVPPGEYRACRYCGAPGQTVCEACRKTAIKDKRPQSQGVELTEEVKKEIRRRLSKFESPTSIARTLGLSHHQMTDFLHPNRKRNKK